MKRLIHRMNQTAHISLQILSMSKSVEKKSTGSAKNPQRAPLHVSLITTKPDIKTPHHTVPSVPSSQPTHIAAPPVRGVLWFDAGGRNPFFAHRHVFFAIRFYGVISALCAAHSRGAADVMVLSRCAAGQVLTTSCVVLKLIPKTPHSAGAGRVNHPVALPDSGRIRPPSRGRRSASKPSTAAIHSKGSICTPLRSMMKCSAPSTATT